MVKPLLSAFLLVSGTTTMSSAAEPPTRVVLYTVTEPLSGKLRPGYSVTKKLSGSCWTGSLSSARPDAWRCMVGNEIHDPCYAPAANASVVYCPDYRQSKHLIAILLTKPLPVELGNHGTPNLSGTPTYLILAAGVECNFITGATGVVGGMRINYGCSDGRMLLGEVNRSWARWRIYAMPRGASSDVTLVDVETAIY
jgi:hypothetical protein